MTASGELSIIEQRGALQANLKNQLGAQEGKLEWYGGLTIFVTYQECSLVSWPCFLR